MANTTKMNLDEKSAKGMRQYFYEYVVIALVMAVVVLFYQANELNKFIRERMTSVIESNTAVMQNIHNERR